MKCVILAGGFGDRLWPLSRKNFPKQFLNMEVCKPRCIVVLKMLLEKIPTTNLHRNEGLISCFNTGQYRNCIKKSNIT